MHKLGTLLPSLLLLAAPLTAGVVYEIEVTDHSGPAPHQTATEIAAQGNRLSMGISGAKGKSGKMHFNGDVPEVKIQDDAARTFFVVDETAVDQIAAMAGQAQQMMEQALAGVPPERRAEIEKVMKQRGVPGMSAGGGRPKSELRKTDERGSKAGYPCVKYIVLRDGVTIRELWVTDWDNLEGGDELAAVFRQMADFFSRMMDAVADSSGGLAGALDDNSFEHMKELDGFPVVTREFDGDRLESESSLRGASRRTLDPAAFEPPAGYKRREMLGGS